ncbi:MAG: hypothetical protein CM15mV45_200 [uncultured marine virus]|nr:MAG: hypothetical protein CM15mV45_200 [uncultured marine virus]
MNATGKIRINSEVIIYTSISGNNIICEASGRGADDTTAAGHTLEMQLQILLIWFQIFLKLVSETKVM